MFNKNIFIKKAYQDYLMELKFKNKLESISLSDKEIKSLGQSKYNLTQFEIYMFIKVSDYLLSHGEYRISFSEGIYLNHNKFRNVLVHFLSEHT